MYVEELVGTDTVNTVPPATIDAFRDHGVVRRTIDQDYGATERVMRELAEGGISVDEITDELQADGVKLFAASFAKISETTARKADEIRKKASAA